MEKHIDALTAKTPAGFESVEKDHGRIETRRYRQSEDIAWFEDKKAWDGLRGFCLVESVREYGGRAETNRPQNLDASALRFRRAALYFSGRMG